MNIYLHGATYGYKSSLATPSRATGTLSFDMSYLPPVSSDVVTREVIFGIRNPETEIGVDEITFTSRAIYNFTYDKKSYKTIIAKDDGSVTIIPATSAVLDVPLYDFKQEKTETVEFTLPNYNYGSYYTYNFSVIDEFVSNVDVFIKMPEATGFERYTTESVKYLIDSNSLVVFFNKISNTDYTIEFGSGVHGNWVPGATVRLVIYKTLGEKANFGKETKATIAVPEQAVVYDKYPDGSIQSTTITPEQYFKVMFQYSDGGIDPLFGEKLRKSLVNFVQTRDNFISERDFYNVIEKYTTDFRILFKKMSVQENVFYLLRALRDNYQIPVRSFNMMQKIFKPSEEIRGIHYYSSDDGILTPGMYFYKIYAYDIFGNIIESEEIKATLFVLDRGAIRLRWSSVENAVKYRVYYRAPEYDKYVDIIGDPELFDDGYKLEGEQTRSTTEALPDVEHKPQILFPIFERDGEKFISPFLYEYNIVMNYYDGYLFYPEIINNFASVEQNNKIDQSGIVLPPVYNNIIYDTVEKKSFISIKSHQDISAWNFRITIPELNISSLQMVNKDESTFTFDYSDNNGIIGEAVTISIIGNMNGSDIFTARTDKIYQRYDTSDLVQIPTFDYSGTRYLIDIPVMLADEFLENKQFYLDKILSFILGFNFEENRMISDNLEFRFLNTDSIRSYLLSNATVQGGRLFKGVTWINNLTPSSIASVPDKAPTYGASWIIGENQLPIYATNVNGSSIGIYGNKRYGGNSEGNDFEVTSPYEILISGDVTKEISALHVIKIKDVKTAAINGEYHVIKSYFNETHTIIEVLEELTTIDNDGVVSYANYEPWRIGGPDNVALWNSETNSWKFISIKPNDGISIKLPTSQSLVYGDDFYYHDYVLRLPLNLELEITIDKSAVVQFGINLEEEKEKIKLELAQYLQQYLTGTDIIYYPSTIIDFVVEPRRVWIKNLKIKTFDSSKNPNIFLDGLEALPEQQIRKNIAGSKLEMLLYTSAFYHWNVDNINIYYTNDSLL